MYSTRFSSLGVSLVVVVVAVAAVAVEKGKGASGMRSTSAKGSRGRGVDGRQAEAARKREQASKALETGLRSMCSAVPGFYSGGRN